MEIWYAANLDELLVVVKMFGVYVYYDEWDDWDTASSLSSFRVLSDCHPSELKDIYYIGEL